MQEKIRLKDFIEILYKRKKIIFLMMLVAFAVSVILSYFVLEPVYEARTLIMIKRQAAKDEELYERYDEIIINQKLVKTYEKIVQSKTVLGKAMESLNINMGLGEFRKHVTVEVLEQTEMMEIIVEDTDPEQAAKTANTIASVFMQEVLRIMEIQNINVIDVADVPKEPIKPNRPLIMFFSSFLGMLCGIFIAFLIEFLDDTIKTTNDAEKYLGLQVIGVVPYVGVYRKQSRWHGKLRRLREKKEKYYEDI